jgi:hypothetical protein
MMTKDDYVLICKKCGDELGLEYVPDEQQEPYAYAYVREDGVGQLCWTKKDKHMFKDFLEGWKEISLYTHPHQWQGLTDDEIDKIYADTEPNSKMDTYYMVLSRAIEQALKEKNHG